jgi:hypothetical protein
MQKPECTLCTRIGEPCIYPTRRAVPRKRQHRSPISDLNSTRVTLDFTPMTMVDEILSQMPFTLEETSSSVTRETWNSGPSGYPLSQQLAAPVDTVDDLGNSNTYLSNHNVQQSDDISKADVFEQWTNSDELWPFVPFIDSTASLEDHSLGNGVSFMPPDSRKPFAKFSVIQNIDATGTRKYSLDISASLATELIDVFFVTIQGFLPLFQRRRFYATYGPILHSKEGCLSDLTVESALLLLSMFGLAARFSNADYFTSEEPIHRGDHFISQAMTIYHQTYEDDSKYDCPLTYLSGMALLAYATLLEGLSWRSWILVGNSVRFAYAINLHDTDSDIISSLIDPAGLSAEELPIREERRRLWWILWDMDTFVSSMLGRPFAIDERHMSVLLPIHDNAYMNDIKVSSVPMDHSAYTTCRQLQSSENNSEWAWFLACTAVLRQVLHTVSSPIPDEQACNDVEAVVGYFAIALPESFQLNPGSLLFDDTNFSASNWIMNTAVMLQW